MLPFPKVTYIIAYTQHFNSSDQGEGGQGVEGMLGDCIYSSNNPAKILNLQLMLTFPRPQYSYKWMTKDSMGN